MCDWNPATLRDVFMRGLAGYIKDELVAYQLLSTLEGLIEIATRLDLRIQARRRERRSEFQSRSIQPHSFPHSKTPVASASSSLASTAPVSVKGPEPMQLERERRPNLCMYCGQTGHLSPVSSKSQSSPVNGGILVSSIIGPASPKRRSLTGEFLLHAGSHSVNVLIDSWADGNIIDETLALQLGLCPEKLPSPISASALDGHVLGRVMSKTNPVCMFLPGATVRPSSFCSCLHQSSLSSWGTPGFACPTSASRHASGRRRCHQLLLFRPQISSEFQQFTMT